MPSSLERSSPRRHAAGLALFIAAWFATPAALAQNYDDRPVTSRGRAIDIDRSKETEEVKPAPERRLLQPDSKPTTRAPIGGPPALVFTIDVRWLAASPYRIERDVTTPIEQAVKTLSGVKSVHSSVTGSRAQTLVTFDAREDASAQATAIRNRLDQIKRRLPREASQPLIGWRRDPPT